MDDGTGRGSMRGAGHSAWRATVLLGSGVVVLALFGGMASLVYLGRMSDGPPVLFVGVVLGYLMWSVLSYRRVRSGGTPTPFGGRVLVSREGVRVPTER